MTMPYKPSDAAPNAVGAGRAAETWQRLDNIRQPMMTRLEKLCSYTLQHLMVPDGWDANRDGATHDYQSIGAQAVNHLATKIMLAMFAPTRPFLRLDPTDALLEAAAAAGMKEEDIKNVLSQAERKAIKELDRMAARPRLFELIKQLIVLGNSLMILEEKEDPRVLNLRRFVVKRSLDGKLHTLVIREVVKKDELSDEARAKVPTKDADSKVCYYIMVTRTGNDSYDVSHWVDEHEMEDKRKTFNGQNLPYRVIAWNLADYADYGTGLAEEYMGALAALSTLSASIIQAAVLAGEFRWLANPAGLTRPDDFNNSENGACLPGQEGDLTLVQAAQEVANAVNVNRQVLQDYATTVGRGFLMIGSVQRDAERVTAEEIRLMAQELETGLGGAYSRLAVDVQLPLGLYLMARVDVRVNDQTVQPTVVTGLDALSRNGDLDALKSYLSDVAQITALPPEVLKYLPMSTILTDLATGHGLDAKRYAHTEQQAQAVANTETAREVQANTAAEAGKAQAQAAASRGA
jgi:hypothetical protein